MLDIRFIRENIETVGEALIARGEKNAVLGRFKDLDRKRRELIRETEDLKRRKNELSQKIGGKIKAGGDAKEDKAQVKELSAGIEELDKKLSGVDEEFFDLCDRIPNLPHASVPPGLSAEENVVVKEEDGRMPDASLDHLQLGEMNGLFDLERAAKITGSGFPLYSGQGARLERALLNFMLDIHTREHGYEELFPPFLVNRNSMRGTGQIPKLEDDMYRIESDDLFLIPTAEVPVTNLYAGEVIPEEKLPICYTAYTACFRREAGSYGKDTKGLSRVHQFNKVELVKFTRPEESLEHLQMLVKDAEDILSRLGLKYRVLELCAGDLSFAAQKCYDIELWAPGMNKWLEVSSCSVFGDFQARRANIKYQPSDATRKACFLHTLNGSGVALPRLVIALLESYQAPDGSVEIPEPLRPYFQADRITPVKDKS